MPGTDRRDLPVTPRHRANRAARPTKLICRATRRWPRDRFCAVPAERLVIVRELLPSLQASVGTTVTRTVDGLPCVRFASARYSVAVRLIGSKVRLRIDGRLLVIMAATGKVVAEHVLVASGDRSAAPGRPTGCWGARSGWSRAGGVSGARAAALVRLLL